MTKNDFIALLKSKGFVVVNTGETREAMQGIQLQKGDSLYVCKPRSCQYFYRDVGTTRWLKNGKCAYKDIRVLPEGKFQRSNVSYP